MKTVTKNYIEQDGCHNCKFRVSFIDCICCNYDDSAQLEVHSFFDEHIKAKEIKNTLYWINTRIVNLYGFFDRWQTKLNARLNEHTKNTFD